MSEQPTNTGAWKMPEWMKKYAPYFCDTGAVSVESLMNTYGAKCAAKLADVEKEEVLVLKAIIANAQVGLLTHLKSNGFLKE